MVDNLLPSIKARRHVYTNIPFLSPAGISTLLGLAPAEVMRYIHPLTTAEEIFAAYDENAAKKIESIFILDEMREVLGMREKVEYWLTTKLNKASKNGIDFIFIAQLPSYFGADTRALGDGCSVFERGERMLKKNRSIEFRFDRNAGNPYRLGKHWDTPNYRYRYRDPKYFRCYSSYEDAQFVANETHNKDTILHNAGLKWGVALLALSGVVIIILVFFLKSTLSFFTNFGKTNEKPVAESVQEEPLQPRLAMLAGGMKEKEILEKEEIEVAEMDSSDCVLTKSVVGGNLRYRLKRGGYVYADSVGNHPSCAALVE